MTHFAIVGVVLVVTIYFLLHQATVDYAKVASTMSAADLNKKADASYEARNYSDALNWYKQSAVKGDPTAENLVGWIYQKGLGVKEDDAEALKWYLMAAVQGFAASQTNAGWCYQNGLGVAADTRAAIEWYQKAIAQGNDSAEINMGYLYENGIGVAKNLSEAKKWYKTAADHGSQEAQRDLDALDAKQVNLNAILHH
jgi:TPR repeat protein